MVMHLWKSGATFHMHSLHFGFGFGALLAPQVARPFLGPDTDNDTGNKLLQVASLFSCSTLIVHSSIAAAPNCQLSTVNCLL